MTWKNTTDRSTPTQIEVWISRLELLHIVCRIAYVSDEWWLYCYSGDGTEDLVAPSTHKTCAAAKRRAKKNVLAWIDARRAEVLK